MTLLLIFFDLQYFMLKNNKIIIFIIVFTFIQTSFIFSNVISGLIKEKKWNEIGSYFVDDSHLVLKKKFNDYLKIHLIEIKEHKIKYIVKYKNYGEIGFIEFKKNEKKYNNLKIKVNFANMKFINSFNKYHINNRSVQVGDAKIKFIKGDYYIADPIKNLVFFNGSYDFDILPDDIEEQKTLNYLYKSSIFTVSRNRGIFVFSDETIRKLFNKEPEENKKLNYQDSKFIKDQLNAFRNEYAIYINEFKEFWYLPFSTSLNMVYLQKSNLNHKYVYNKNNVPDTFLYEINSKKHILNYNQIKGMKFFSADSNDVKKIQLYIRLNPNKFKIWTTALLIFPKAVSFKVFQIFKEMKVHDFYVENDDDLDYMKKGDTFKIIGKEFKDFSFYYSGILKDNRKKLEIAKYKFNNTHGKIDNYIFFDNENKFYPNPGNQFFESTLKISIPENTNILASGFLRSIIKKNKRKELIFKSDGTKGLTMVSGNFTKLDVVKSEIPINIYGADNLNVRKYLKKNEIKKSFDFLYNLYGKRDIESVNLLFRRWLEFGGVSYKGFVVFNVVRKSMNLDYKKTMIEYYKSNPVFFTNKMNRDNLVHELAHQWWGGIISWKTYKDVWITEGGAQFSTLLYLESILSKKRFSRIINKVIRRVRKESKAGPIIYGNRIANLANDTNTYQSTVYNKSSLLFFMLREMIGKENLFKKFNKIFSKYLKKSIPSKKFIKEIIKDEKNETILFKFFNKWIYSREIPVLNYKINIENTKATVFFEQKNTDFVFPIKMNIEIENKKNCIREERIIIISNKTQKLVLDEKNTIKAIKFNIGFSPIVLKKK